ncbi:MAG TPA: lysophospholipid acyltransferase family protein [Thermoanaerobaculia bacterium]|nr:lysophospholipid acyltransferase family protein [Thermoanaerobaculia bacterium]
MRSRSWARHRAEHLLFRAVSGTLGLLPEGSAAAFGSIAGRLSLQVARSRKRILLENLAAAFPERSENERRRIAQECIDRFGATFMEFLESSALSRAEVEERVTVEGVEHLQAARQRGKGVFLLSAHFGSWEIGAVRAGLLGEPISSVVRPLDNPLLEEELARRRTRFGNRLIQKKDAAREVLRAIRAGQTVAILIDQNVLAEEAIFVPFFGRLAATTPSLALFQMKTDAAVVPVFTWPIGGGRYRLVFETPILASEFESAPDRSERVRQATARYTAAAERAIREYPAAWLWMHNRWRTRPEGEAVSS